MEKVDLDELQQRDIWKSVLCKIEDIPKIIAELKAARGAIELLENIEEFAWDVDREKSQEILYKYHEVTNGKG